MEKKTRRNGDIVIQSFWTKPILRSSKNQAEKRTRIIDNVFMMALSLAYAHRSGYRIHMHTDSNGYEMLKDFGYDKLLKTLDTIPSSVPKELFAAGKFYAMREEGTLDKVHIDYDVFLKKEGVLDEFYRNKNYDVVVQHEECYKDCHHIKQIMPNIKAIGHTESTVPEWEESWNTGIIGFHNRKLAKKYMDNYFKSLEMYTEERFREYEASHPGAWLCFDFFLEQINIAHMSRGYNVLFLLDKSDPTKTADEKGYQHLQGGSKYTPSSRSMIRSLLFAIDPVLYGNVKKALKI